MRLSTASAEAIDTAIRNVTADPYHQLPRAVVMVASKDKILYTGSGGFAKLPPFPAEVEALAAAPLVSDESMFTLWSCTKLVTVIAALQLVERGLIKVDDEASLYVKELKDAKVLAGFKEDGEPILEPNDVPITVEMLICHTAGLTYDNHPDFIRYLEYIKPKRGIYTRDFSKDDLFALPFVHKPGAHWHYGLNNDFLGLVVESVSGQSLEAFFQQNIFAPLGINDMTFVHNPATIQQAISGLDGGPSTIKPPFEFSQEQFFGGAGLAGSPKSYLILIQSLLNGGVGSTGARILNQETVDSMFVPHLHTAQQCEDVAEKTIPMIEPFTLKQGKAFPGVNWGYGGSLSGSDLPSGRKARSLSWSGYANTFWVIDRTTGLAFVLFSNIVPSQPGAVRQRMWPFWEAVEVAIYRGIEK